MSPAPAKQPPRPALETAFALHYAFVRERLRGLGVAAADLDDATQDVFEVLVRRIADYDPQRPMRAWMAGMARKVARRYRDRGRRAVVSLDERRPALDDSPEVSAARAEAWLVLQRFVDELEPERWSVFVLSEIEGLRGSEIAAELGVNLNTVYARLRSARAAFERTLARHRARERRGLAALLVWPSQWSRRWVWGGAVTLSGGLALSAAIVSCEVDEHAQPRAELDSSESVSVAARPSKPTNVRVLASDTAAGSSAEAWIPSGSGFSTSSNANGERYTLSTEARHRLDADHVILEVTYIGDDDDDIDEAGHQLTLDGLELVDGATEWELPIPAGETRVVSTTLRASRDGVVRLRMTTQQQSGGGSGSRRFAWMHAHGLLRPCEERECEVPIGAEQLAGERITVHVHNECEVAKQFVLFAGYPEIRPDDSVQVHSLEPDEHRSMEIDAAQWFLHRDSDGKVGGGVRTDDDGARVTFSGSGETCSAMSTASPRD